MDNSNMKKENDACGRNNSTTTLEFDNSSSNYYAAAVIAPAEEEEDEQDNFEDGDDAESDYSLDYEFPGPRYANFRSTTHDNDQASDLSDQELDDQERPRFDMWDDDPYNDFTWESNDMQLTKFMKAKKRKQQQSTASFWKKERGWPRQLPFSCSSTNHDQSANAICLVQSNYGLSEQLFAVYRDRIIQCGNGSVVQQQQKKAKMGSRHSDTTTCLDRGGRPSSSSSSSSSVTAVDKFIDTHQSVSLSKLYNNNNLINTTQPLKQTTTQRTEAYIKKFKPYTKYIKRSDFPPVVDPYLSLGFEPQCLAIKYGYMAIGGVEGEFELYCCMEKDKKKKIWGTKFIRKDNVMLMTNAIQLIRWQNNVSGEYQHMLIGCMNEAGLLFYHLPPHQLCQDYCCSSSTPTVKLHSHLRSFNGVPINDAKLSPDGTKLVCVGDYKMIFMIDVSYHNGEISFGNNSQLVIPSQLLHQQLPYSSQYVAWSPSSQYFAHTSDSHNLVIVWKKKGDILYTIDAAGYTYAISFHPFLDHILVFTNRYGYFHTVDLSKASSAKGCSATTINLLTFDQAEHQCLQDTCIEQEDWAVFHTRHLQVQHEITIISFRGEVNTSLRILAKINGIEWSKDGKYLYVATKKRVLAYQLNMTQGDVPSLLNMTGLHIRGLLEEQQVVQRCSKRQKLNNDITSTLNDWSIKIPDDVQSRILGDTQQLACHW